MVVVGPRRLPGLLRTLGQWIGGAKRTVADIRRKMEDELHLAEIQQEIEESTAVRQIREAPMTLGQVTSSADESNDPGHWPGMPPDGPDA